MRRVQVQPEELPGHVDEKVTLPESQTHYLRDVLRMQVGDHVELFDGEGTAWRCQIVAMSPFSVEAREPVIRQTESSLKVTLLQAIPKGDRWEWVLEKATELGVHEIVPVETSRTVVTVPAKKLERKMERWNKILASAARQSQRTFTPELQEPTDFAATLSARHEDLLLYGHPGRAADDSSEAPKSVAIWIGPEGGFSDDELASLAEIGAQPLDLGPRVLRSETAGAFACGLVQARWGDLA